MLAHYTWRWKLCLYLIYLVLFKYELFVTVFLLNFIKYNSVVLLLFIYYYNILLILWISFYYYILVLVGLGNELGIFKGTGWFTSVLTSTDSSFGLLSYWTECDTSGLWVVLGAMCRFSSGVRPPCLFLVHFTKPTIQIKESYKKP